jgi:signal transduction histidine kinase
VRSSSARSLWAPGLTLGSALVIVLALGAIAVTTARYFRTTTDAVLRDYAGLAADQVVPVLETRLAQRLYPVLVAARPVHPAGPPPHPDRLRDAVMAGIVQDVAATFVSRASGLRVLGDAALGLDSLWLAATRGTARVHIDSGAYLVLAWSGVPDGPVAVYDAVRDGTGVTDDTYGVVIPAGALREDIRRGMRDRPLLPPSLARRVPPDSVVGLAVLAGPRRMTLLDTGLDPSSPFVADRPLRSNFGLAVRVALHPATAPRLLALNAPKGQGVILTVLMASAILLIALAWVLLRQDRQLTALREDFLTSVSHELRTPLAQIRLFADTLALDRVRSTAERDESVSIISAETRRLSHLVDNLLSFSRSERGVLAPELVPGDLAAEVERVVQDFEPLATLAGSAVVLELEGPVPARFDPDSMRRIVLNLLDNALKYGPAGQAIQVRVGRQDGLAQVVVTDRGPGVPAEQRRRVWERFWRGPDARRTGTAGAGIGLAVVAELVRLHGGAARVDGGPAGGARFVVELPLAEGAG